MILNTGGGPGSWWRLFGVALVVVSAFGLLTVLMAVVADLPLRDPDGLFGPSYIRLPLIAVAMMGADIVPRTLSRRRTVPTLRAAGAEVLRERWPGPRLAIVAAGLVSFYVSYVAYRNLKSYLPFLRDELTDYSLVASDRLLAGGNHPGDLLHELLGTGISADVLSVTYMFFLLFVPVSLAAALVWSDDLTRGAWYVTALSFNWVLGTASYYLLPSLGPIYVEAFRFSDLPRTEVTGLQESLLSNRVSALADPHASEAIQGIAAFASLHVSIVFTAALVVHMSGVHRLLRSAMWVFVALTALATIYFGWHYLVDVAGGLAVGGLSVGLAARAVGRPGALEQPALESAARA